MQKHCWKALHWFLPVRAASPKISTFRSSTNSFRSKNVLPLDAVEIFKILVLTEVPGTILFIFLKVNFRFISKLLDTWLER
jgi:hypothetical protein